MSSLSGSPANLPSPRAAVLPAAPTGRRHRPAPHQRAHRRHRPRLGRTHRRLSLNCTQADMQDMLAFLVGRVARQPALEHTRAPGRRPLAVTGLLRRAALVAESSTEFLNHHLPQGSNLHSGGEICGFLSRLVASQTATFPTPFAYFTFSTLLPVTNGIQPEAHSPTRYVSLRG
jgi:hypothetical protein